METAPYLLIAALAASFLAGAIGLGVLRLMDAEKAIGSGACLVVLMLAAAPTIAMLAPLPALSQAGDVDATGGAPGPVVFELVVVFAERVSAIDPGPSAMAFSVGVWVLGFAYVLGFLLRAGYLAVGLSRLRWIVVHAERDDAFGDRVWVTSKDVSPFSCGIFRRRIVLPAALINEAAHREVELIVAHERAHLDRRDPILFLLLSVFETVFWFNPFVRRLAERCRFAAETDCDRRVVSGAPGKERLYAQTLINVFKNSADAPTPSVPAVFCRQSNGEAKVRIQNIMNPARFSRKLAILPVLVMGVAVCPAAYAAVAMSDALREGEAGIASTLRATTTSPSAPPRISEIRSVTLRQADSVIAQADAPTRSAAYNVAKTYEMRADAMRRTGDMEGAIRYYREAININGLPVEEAALLERRVEQLTRRFNNDGQRDIGDDRSAAPLKRVPPRFPAECLKGESSVNEVVELTFDVNPAGDTANIRVTDTTNACFDDAASAAVARWEYAIKLVDGAAVWRRDVVTQIRFMVAGEGE